MNHTRRCSVIRKKAIELCKDFDHENPENENDKAVIYIQVCNPEYVDLYVLDYHKQTDTVLCLVDSIRNSDILEVSYVPLEYFEDIYSFYKIYKKNERRSVHEIFRELWNMKQNIR